MAEDNIALTRRWFEEVWNQRKAATIDELLSPQVISHGIGELGDPVIGCAGFKKFHRTMLAAFPDLHIEVADAFGSGDRVAARLVCEGTHRGDDLGMPATGQRVKFSATCILRFKDGRMIEGWNEVDTAGMLRQLGVAPPGAAAISMRE